MSLLQLPPELLDEIVGHTLPDGLESFVLSCKLIHEVGKSHIAQHNAYKQEWKRFAYSGGPAAMGPRSALQLIQAIAQNPVIALYIEKAELWFKGGITVDHLRAIRATVLQLRDDRASVAAIRKLLLDSRYLKVANQDPDIWWQRIQLDDEYADEPGTNYATVFLLTLLPNVKELILPFAWKNIPGPDAPRRPNSTHLPPEVWPVLDAITLEASDGTRQPAALGKLERVLPYAKDSYDTRNGLRELGMLMAMSSVREMHACNCVAVDDGYTGIPFKWRYPNCASGLRTIELAACCIDSDGISELVRHTPQLSSLKYSHHTKWHGCLHDWDAGGFVAAIGRHLGGCITELAVTIDRLYGDIDAGVASMREFEKLESVELDLRVFCGPATASGQRQGMSATQRSSLSLWTRKDIPCLADILPLSIKRVDLFSRGEAEAAAITTLKNLLPYPVDKQRSLFPALEHLAVRRDGSMAFDPALRLDSLCTVGVEHGRAKKPLWREAYCRRFGD